MLSIASGISANPAARLFETQRSGVGRFHPPADFHKPSALRPTIAVDSGGARTQHFCDPEAATRAGVDPCRERLWRHKPSAVRAIVAGIAGGARTPACRVGTRADTQPFRAPEAATRVALRHARVRAPRLPPVFRTFCREVYGECRHDCVRRSATAVLIVSQESRKPTSPFTT